MLEAYLSELLAPYNSHLKAAIKSWQDGIAYELEFWENWVQTEGGEWKDDFQQRLKPKPLAAWLVALLPTGVGKVKILDVGSGPITKTGHKVEDRVVEVTAVDPLANKYSAILSKFGIVPPLRTEFAFSEDLSARFDHGSFDLICSTNALDHAIEPVWGILEMFICLRTGGKIFLSHRQNEAEVENYSGFHQWNFDESKGQFVIWNRTRRQNVSELLSSVADTQVKVSGDHISVTITKVGELPIDQLQYQRRLRARLLEVLLE